MACASEENVNLDLLDSLNHDALMDYCEFNRENPVSIPIIHEIIGGPNHQCVLSCRSEPSCIQIFSE